MNSTITPLFSNNISVIKVFAIIGIVFGHFGTTYPAPVPFMKNWWVISAIGLLIFSITSGLFTGLKYNIGFDIKSYWIKKFLRIGLPFTILNSLLLILFMFQKRDGLWSIQTVASWLGLHGFWTWFKIQQAGPYGAGLWFMTALIIFYLFYPLFEFINRKQIVSNLFTLIAIILFLFWDRTIPMGHTLWLTVSGFFLGVWAAKNQRTYHQYFILTVITAAILMMIVFKYFFHTKALSGLFMLTISFSIVELCYFIKFPPWVYKIFLPLSSCVLSIYVIHMYMFITPSGIFLIDCLFSLLIILAIAFFVDFLSKKLLFCITSHFGLYHENDKNRPPPPVTA